MLNIIFAPDEKYSLPIQHSTKLFLAGGITNCPDWQTDAINAIGTLDEELKLNLTIYNPRRPNFDINQTNVVEEQIVWEFDHLKNADIICFWFAKGSINPIVLYELGKWGNSKEGLDKTIIIGCDPEYPRITDVVIQTLLVNENALITDNFDSFLNELMTAIINKSEEF